MRCTSGGAANPGAGRLPRARVDQHHRRAHPRHRVDHLAGHVGCPEHSASPPNAGLDVLTTVNIQHVDGVKDLIERITGITVRETIPDWLLDEADDLQFIDITQEALRKRMRHGNIHPSQRIEPALRNFFSETNLTALREIGRRLGLDGPAERRGAGGRGRAGPAARRRSGRAA